MVKTKLLHVPFFVLAICLSFSALAQSQAHPRRVWSITTTDMRQAIIAVDSQLAWNMYEISHLDSVCSESGYCAKVTSVEPSRYALLPFGWIFHLSRPIVGVNNLFRNPSDFGRELTQMGRDPVLSRLIQQIVSMKQRNERLNSGTFSQRGKIAREKPKPAVWYDKTASPWSMEFGSAVTAGIRTADQERSTVFLYGASLRLGFRYQGKLQSHYSSDCISGLFEAIWELIQGNQFGADLRLHWMREADHNQFLLGIQPLSRVVSKPNMEFARLRFPGLLSIVVPEGGLLVDENYELGGYIRWVAPISLLLTHDVGLELRLIEGIMWEAETTVFFGAQLGLFVR